MAIAPFFERQRLIEAALSKATITLQAPVDRIEVQPDKVVFRAGAKELTIRYRYERSHPDDARVLGTRAQLLLDDKVWAL